MIKLTARIVTGYLAGNTVATSDLPGLIQSVHWALTEADQNPATNEAPAPATTIMKSVATGHVVCLDCGRQMKMLKRHLTVDHGLTLDAYRSKWNLPPNHPLIAPDYSKKRSALARKAGLGVKREEIETAAPAVKIKRARPPKPAPAPVEPTPVKPALAEPALAEPKTRGHYYPANRWAKPTGN